MGTLQASDLFTKSCYISSHNAVQLMMNRIRSGQSVSSDEDNEEEVLDGDVTGELGTLSRQERDRAGTVFHHCATAVRKNLLLCFISCIAHKELAESNFPGD